MKKVFVASDSLNKRLISTLMSTKRIAEGDAPTDFTLKSSTDFASRSGDIFGKLQPLESDHKDWVSSNKTLVFEDPMIEDTFDCKPKKTESDVFRRPLPMKKKFHPAKRISKPKRISQKWVKYSLEDVELSSDATNKAVGLKFFEEIKKAQEKMQEPAYDGVKKLVFKPKTSVGENSANVVSSSSDCPLKKNKREKKKSESISSTIKLAHLDDDETDEM